jgi:hypothetical protein
MERISRIHKKGNGNMDIMEQNRQTVQAGLDKRSSSRKKAIVEAEQEVITIQMFRIVNANADNADNRHQVVCNQIATTKANHRRNKKIAELKKNRKRTLVNIIASILALVVIAVFYAVDLTEIIYAIAISVLPIFMLIFNLCILAKTQKKLKRTV